MTPRPIDIKGGATSDQNGASDSDLRGSILVYLIAERPEGATIGHISALGLGGREPTDEVARVAAAVSRLEQDGEVTMMDGKHVIPVRSEMTEPGGVVAVGEDAENGD